VIRSPTSSPPPTMAWWILTGKCICDRPNRIIADREIAPACLWHIPPSTRYTAKTGDRTNSNLYYNKRLLKINPLPEDNYHQPQEDIIGRIRARLKPPRGIEVVTQKTFATPPTWPLSCGGSLTILINRLAASRLRYTIVEALEPPNKILAGCTTVLISG